MTQFILATQNKHKVKEISKILGIKLLSLLDFDNPLRIIENAKTFEGNAIKKAKTVAKKFQLPAIADDSGLVVDCLGGAPGVKSARYAGPNPTKEKLCKKLLKEIARVKKSRPKAKFVCCVAIVWPNGKTKVVRGEVHGHIIDKMRGKNGFGYDPVFVPRGYKKTFAEMKSSFKNRISHRGRAFRKIAEVLHLP